jgi:CheY-like chemotaxis protein
VTQVVVCEDDSSIQKLVKVTLSTMDCAVGMASDGVAGLELVEQLRPDLIITDIYMPLLDGFAMVDAIRLRPLLETIPVLFITAGVQRWQLERAARVRAAECLQKPFSPAELRARVMQLIKFGARPPGAESVWRKANVGQDSIG